MALKLKGNRNDILIIQIYAPNEDDSDEEKEKFYEEMNNIISENMKFTDTLLVVGDFNGRVSNRKEDNICGPFELGDARTDNGGRIVEFCRRNKLLVANTWFQQKEKTRHTWTSPDGQTKNQIDYILVSARFRNSIRNCKSRPGAYCGSDHNPVIVNLNKKKSECGCYEASKRKNGIC
ncbi:craniofacial development protein 2-like [Penaeus vannamei]|uniref:craniofacial development protein 2-like n=1 Tax=Penaeus vannamei TaxID=6689 RepID=UPI00387F8F91